MEIVGPEPIWKLNFSGDDTDLVNIIRANLSDEQANDLISLLKEKPGKKQKENLDEDITSLLSQLYTNIYGEDIELNPFINDILYGDVYNNCRRITSRYYFNSELIEKEAPYKEETIYIAQPNSPFWYVYVFSSNYKRTENLKNDIYNGTSEELFMLTKEQIEINSIKELTKDLIEKYGIKFYYQGKELTIESLDLYKYENESVNWLGGINPEVQEKVRRTYYPTIYESFPEQRIGETKFTK